MTQEHAARSGEWAGQLIPTQELLTLLERFGMQVGLDTSRRPRPRCSTRS